MTIVVTPRENPDLDGTACAIAYAELLRRSGRSAVAWLSGVPDAEARFVLDRLGVPMPPQPTAWDGVVLVDASDVAGLPAAVVPLDVVEVVDHRWPHQAAVLFPNATLRIERVGAAATLIAESFDSEGVAPSAASAMLLIAAIQSNTQMLKGAVTTSRDVDASSALVRAHPLPDGFLNGQFEARGHEIRLDLGAALRRECKSFENPSGPYFVSQLELPGACDLVDACLAASGLPSNVLINLVDPLMARSALVVSDPHTRAWVQRRTGLVFDGVVATCQPTVLRKQLAELLAGAR